MRHNPNGLVMFNFFCEKYAFKCKECNTLGMPDAEN